MSLKEITLPNKRVCQRNECAEELNVLNKLTIDTDYYRTFNTLQFNSMNLCALILTSVYN